MKGHWALPLAGLLGLTAIHAQSFTFDVVSIKPAAPGQRNSSIAPTPGGRFVATNVTAQDIIGWAYQQPRDVITGGPSWVDTERFDIDARPESAVTSATVQILVTRMLAEQFRLRAHLETRQMAGFVLELKRADGTLGPNMKRVGDACRDAVAPPDTADDRPPCLLSSVPGMIATRGATSIDTLARLLRIGAGGPVVNRTGLGGIYELRLRWTPDMNATANGPTDFPSLFTAIEEQLGLTLKPQRVPQDFIVIDAIERPAAM